MRVNGLSRESEADGVEQEPGVWMREGQECSDLLPVVNEHLSEEV